MTDNTFDPTKDYLEEDSTVPGQKYCCISFVEPPEEVEKHVEVFIFNKFLKHIAKNFTFTPRIVSTGSVGLEIEDNKEETKVEESKQIEIQEVVEEVIRKYTREAGVRQLEQMLGRVTRKIALQLAEEKKELPVDPITVTPELIEVWLGTERFMPEEARKILPTGVATGLAWTPTGGDVLYVETTLLPGSDDIRLTGQLGDVMQESAHAARSYLWSHAESMGLDISCFKRNGVHVHVPSGAIPKDGPSAGLTMAIALASAYRNTPVRSDTAMTGEVSLSGLVLPVGGIKEKVLGAKRAGITKIILPKKNEKDLREVPDRHRKGISFFPVEHFDEVLKIAIAKK